MKAKVFVVIAFAALILFPCAGLGASGPSITTPPQSQSVPAGSNAVFTVVASGQGPLAYQWSLNGTNLANNAHIGGATEATLTISSVTNSDAGVYQVVVSNSHGAATTNATLTVLLPPVITSQPQGLNVNWGGDAFYSVVATNVAPITYQWRFNGLTLAGQTNSTLLLTNVQPSQAGIYAVDVISPGWMVRSSSAYLMVDMPPEGVPFILGFSPLQAYPGATIGIFGTNFSSVISNNIVRFGAVRANVISASSNILTVTVPVSASLAPITVTVNGLTAFSRAPFLPTFPGGGAPVNTSTFAPRQTLSTLSGPIQTVIADLDGDGKPDLVVANDISQSVSFFRNISTGGVLSPASFSTRVDLPPISVNGNDPVGISVADVDGDGKPDILVCDRNQNQILIYRNVSTTGVLSAASFAPPVAVASGAADPRHVRVADLDGDGKPDLVVANYGQNSVSIFQNTSTPGNISFLTNPAFTSENGVYDVALADLDGDGKTDIAVANTSASFISIWRNQGSPGVMSFAPYTNFPSLDTGESIMALDVDGDGKLDLVTGSIQSDAASVFRNQSVPGRFSFAPHVDFSAPGWVHNVAAGDINGDGKPDICIDGELGNFMAVFQNGSTPGSFTAGSLGSRVDFPAGYNVWGISVGDLDGDGRPDVAVGNFYDGNLSVYQNQIPYGGPPVIFSQPTNRILSANNTAVFHAVVVGQSPLSYRWYFNGTNLTDGAHYAGSGSDSLAVSNILPADSGNYYLIATNTFGSVTSVVATLTVLFPPDIIIQPANPSVPIGSNITLTATGTGANPMSYQWRRNGTNLTDGGNISGTTTPALTLANVQLGDASAYSVVVTNIYGSITNATNLRVTVPAGTWVKWDASLGGNGHWYKGVVNTTGLNWLQADQAAHNDGGYLATITSAQENSFVFNLVNDPQFFSGSGGNGSGPALGGVRTNSTSPAGADWIWETGEPWSYTTWAPGQPDDLLETRLEFWSGIQGNPSPNWNNLSPTDANLGGYIVEREDFPSILYQPTDATVAIGTNVSLMVVALGSPTLTYQWVANGTNIGGATNASLLLTNVQLTQAGNYSVTVSNPFGTITSSNATLTVMAPPAFTQSPTNVSAIAGSAAIFSAIVTGDPPLSYQWQFNGSPLSDSLHIAGSATDTLTISNVQNSDMGNYTLTVTNPVGSASSTAAVLTVLTPPAITIQPLGRSTPLGLSNAFTAAASGSAPLSYQWQLNGTNIPGATNSTCIIAAVGTNDLGVYQFVATNAAGVAVSSNALLTAGPVAAWGYNFYNQCIVPPGLSNVTTIGNGYTYSLASRLDGTIAGWGNLINITNSGMTNVVAISAGINGALVLRADGSVGGSTTVGPDSAKVYLSNAVAVAVGGGFGMALRQEGTVTAWGSALGSALIPMSPPPGLTHVTAIAAGYQHALGLRSDGTVAAWGIGSATNVPIGLSNVVSIAGGQTHSLALKSDGTLVAWGAGAGTNIPAGLSNVMAIAAGGFNDQRSDVSIAVKSNGTVVAWGLSGSSSQTNPPAGLTNVVGATINGNHTLALVNDGSPQILRAPVGGVVWSGNDFTLRVVAAGTALNYRWLFNGTNIDGATNATLALPAIQATNAGNYQIIVSNALGTAASLPAPVTVMDSAPFVLTQSPTNLTGWLGNKLSLTAAAGGSGPLLYRWRLNGTDIPGGTNDTLTFDRLHLTNSGDYTFFVSNSFGAITSSVVKLTVQQLVTWGDNVSGATNMPSGLTNVAAISANFYGNIALRNDGTISIWGNSPYIPTNTATNFSGVTEVSAGYLFNMILQTNGRAQVWGYDAGPVFSNAVAAQSNIVAIEAGNFSCALLKNDGTVVWINSSGVVLGTAMSTWTNVISIEPFDDGVIALRANGTVSSVNGGFSPPSTLTNVLAISSGRYQGLALKRDGRIQDWTQTPPPVGTSNIIAVAASGGFNSGAEFAVRQDGSIVTGGFGAAITNVPYGLSRVLRLDAGNNHCLALLSDRDFPPVFLHNALDTSAFVVSSKGAPQWFGQTNISYDGVSAAQSAPIGNNLSSSMRMWVAGPITVRFWWKVSSAAGHGILSFTAGGTVLTNISGEVDWQQCTVSIPAGNQILQWTYAKDGAAAAGQDAAWVDQLQLVPQPPVITTQPAGGQAVGPTNIVFNVVATGTPPLVYRWWKDGSLIPGANGASLSLTNAVRTNSGTYWVVVTNIVDSVTSSNAVLTVHVPQLLASPVFQPDGSIQLSTTDIGGGQLSSTNLASLQVQVSADLVNWLSLTNALIFTNGTIELQDPSATNFPTRFYRILESW